MPKMKIKRPKNNLRSETKTEFESIRRCIKNRQMNRKMYTMQAHWEIKELIKIST